MPAQELRDYQREGLARILEAFKGGARAVLAVAPTGAGKTSLFASLASQLVQGGRRAVLLVHRRELLDQAANRFREFGVDFGVIMSGVQPKPYASLQLASVPTLVRRTPPPADLVIADEAHLSTAKTWQTILSAYPRARILGVTATPWRLSGKPLVGSYDTSVIVSTPRALCAAGWLCPYVGFSYKAPDLSGVKTTGGDYNEKQSAAVMSAGVIVDNIVEQWQAHARELSTVVFAVTVDHSLQLNDRFRAAGVSSEHLDGETPLEQRRAILKRVETGQTRVLCNVGIAIEGLDIPRLKCCVLARPTKSLARAIQMMGRVRRPWNGITARIHDHAFVIPQHGLPDQDRDYTLLAKPEKPPSLTRCEICFANYEGTNCPNCGAENEPQIVDRSVKTVPDAEKIEFSSEAVCTLCGSSEADHDDSACSFGFTPPVIVKPLTPIKWNNPGRVVQGRYRRSREEPTKYGPQQIYFLEWVARDYEIPGTAQLDRLMKTVPIDSMVRVTYLGDRVIHGGKFRKEFKVEMDA